MSAGIVFSKPHQIPLKPENYLVNPPIPAAFGMALSYYTYPFLNSLSSGFYVILGLFFLLTAAVIVTRVVSFMPYGMRDFGKMAVFAAALSIGFSLGIAARGSANERLDLGLETEKINAVLGVLRHDPRSLQGNFGLGTMELRQSIGPGGLRASAGGKVTVFFPAESIPGLKEFGRGSEIYADGSFFKTERGLLFRASSVHIVKPAPPVEAFRTGLRLFLLEKIQSRHGGSAGEAPVWGSLASALLLGVRDDLDTDLTIAFRNSGCAHILALSGMHLAIISGVLAFFLRRPLGLRWASLIGAIFIIFYIFVAGSQASLVRSGIMYLIGTFTLWGLLKRKALSVLCMAFIIQLLFQNEAGLSLGFILSYSALWGILGLGDSVRNLLRGRLPEVFASALAASLGAFVLTAPIVALYFGSLKPIGILAGLLVIPLCSLFMVLALGALVLSFLPVPLWSLFDSVLTLVYRLLEFSVNLAARVPGIDISNPFPVIIFVVLFWLFILLLQKHDRLYRNNIASFN